MHWISQKAPGGKLGGALVPRPVINTFSLNVPRSGSQGSTIFSPLWVRSAPEVDIGLELETFPSSSAPAGLLRCRKAEASWLCWTSWGRGSWARDDSAPCTESNPVRACVYVCLCVRGLGSVLAWGRGGGIRPSWSVSPISLRSHICICVQGTAQI